MEFGFPKSIVRIIHLYQLFFHANELLWWDLNLKDFFQALGLCHTVIADVKKDKKSGQSYVAYNASSPDELALVNGARHLGFFFKERDEENNMVCETWDGTLLFKLLNLIEFDSTRKRMTVVVRTPEGKILVITKGADSIIEKRLKQG